MFWTAFRTAAHFAHQIAAVRHHVKEKRSGDVVEALVQHGDPPSRLGVTSGRVQRREQGMADDVQGLVSAGW